MRRFGLLALFVPVVLLGADDRVVDRVDINHRVVVRGNRHPQARTQNDRGPADPGLELSYVTALLRPAASLEQFLRDQQDAASPNYRAWLTPEAFADRFGLSAGDTDKVVQWLRSEGLQVHDVARGRTWITFSGSTTRVGRALQTQFRRYSVKGETHVANADEPSVPAALASVIAGFDGLHDFVPAPMHVLADRPLDEAQYNSSGNHYLAPDDFATIYNVKPLYDMGIDGSGVGIAVIGRTAIDMADIQSFRRRHNLPVNDPKPVLFGPDPGKTADMIEADLDVEWAGAVARNATVYYVYATGIRTALQYAVDQNIAPIITYSYGACELGTSNALRYVAQQANAQGITFLAASGDQGAATCDAMSAFTPQAAKGSTLSYPANVPEVTAVGGTQFNDAGAGYWNASNDANGASAISYIPEAVWNEAQARNDLVSSGGGASAFFAKPYWQTGPGVPDDKSRDVPDVSVTASAQHVPYLVVSAGALRGVGGTSAGSPAFASVVALLNHSMMRQNVIATPGLGNINPMLYRLAQTTTDVFHDVVDGDNKVPCVQSSPGCVDGKLGHSAAPGYDLATGLGSIDAFNLVTKWNNGAASTTALTATPNKVDPGTLVTLTATVTGQGSVAPTGSVTFLASSNGVGTAPLVATAAGAVAALSVKAALLLAGSGAVTAYYEGDGVYSNSSGTATLAFDVPASGSFVVPFLSPNPVPQAASGVWPYTVGLTEKAGVATTITGFTVNGVDNAANIAALNAGKLPAKGTVSATLVGSAASIPSVPFDRTFVFTGEDADGTKWTQQITATFVGPMGPLVAPAISLTSSPSSIEQNPLADPACQWSQELTLDEHGGYLVQLTRLVIGGVNVTGQIQPLFGTTRLAPYGVLRAQLCWDRSTVAPATKSYTITGTAEDGTTVTATATVAFQLPPASAPAVSIGPQNLELTVPDNQHEASAAIDLDFRAGAAAWKAAVTPANVTTSWLKLAPFSGTGDGQIALRAATAGLSSGVYRASIAIEIPGAAPDHISIPVVLVVGASDLKIGGVANSASFQQAFAPGMLLSVFGSGLSSSGTQARSLPLPLTLGGITATVNGVAAPIVGTFPGVDQINIQVPYEAGSGPAVLAINNGGRIAHYSFAIAAAAPGLFGIWDTAGRPLMTARTGQAAVAYITGDGDVTPSLATGSTPLAGTAPSRLPKARQPLAVTVGGVPAEVSFNGIPSGVAGVTQINFTVPASVAPGPQAVVVTVGGVNSQPVTLTIQ